jgi:Cu(I)/Ag(I) efflux system membrane fusion protein
MSRSRIVVALIVLTMFAGAIWWYAGNAGEHKHQLAKRTDEQGKVYWTCTMHPQVRQGEPGNCPICGMKLVKRQEAAPAQGRDDGIVEIDPRMVQNLGIRTASVERGTFFQRIDTVGAVDVDERRIVAIESRAAGWVEQLQVSALGDAVKRGQRVAGVYSPELFAAQQELALAVRSKDEALLSATRQRVTLLGLSEAQIRAVLRGGKPDRQVAVIAPADGIVTELNVRQGQQVMPGTPLMRIADLSQIWVTVEIPESRGGWIGEGRIAEARLSAIPGTVLEGKVEYVYPRLDLQTRTLRARVSFPNPELALKPGMFAEVTLFGGPRANTLLVPTEAVIRTGERDVVILAEGEGRFRPAIVEVGDDRQGQTEILAGLREGETVVVSGQFLIDSEASLRGALARMAGEGPQ